jgi:hypothetical protein
MGVTQHNASFAKIGMNGKVIAVHSVVNKVLHDSNELKEKILELIF